MITELQTLNILQTKKIMHYKYIYFLVHAASSSPKDLQVQPHVAGVTDQKGCKEGSEKVWNCESQEVSCRDVPNVKKRHQPPTGRLMD